VGKPNEKYDEFVESSENKLIYKLKLMGRLHGHGEDETAINFSFLGIKLYKSVCQKLPICFILILFAFIFIVT
jgi:hypothetical protein